MTRSEVGQVVRRFFDGCSRQDLLDLHSFLTSEDSEFYGNEIEAQWTLDDDSEPLELEIYVTCRDENERVSFDFTDPNDRQEIEYTIAALVAWLDEGYGL